MVLFNVVVDPTALLLPCWLSELEDVEVQSVLPGLLACTVFAPTQQLLQEVCLNMAAVMFGSDLFLYFLCFGQLVIIAERCQLVDVAACAEANIKRINMI